jgi:hypothetical protein
MHSSSAVVSYVHVVFIEVRCIHTPQALFVVFYWSSSSGAALITQIVVITMLLCTVVAFVISNRLQC